MQAALRLALAIALGATAPGFAVAAEPGAESAAAGLPPVSFRKEIAPLLNRRCAACHNEENAKGHYRVDTFQRLLKPGETDDPPVVAGKPDDSELYRLLLEPDANDRMPQKADPLPPEEIGVIKRWIAEGAKTDGGPPERPLVEMAREVMLRPAPKHYARPAPVTGLAYSPNGEQIAVAGYYEVTFWNVADGRLLRRIGGLPERITSIAWSPKRNLIAVAGGSPAQWGTVALINPADHYKVQILGDLAECSLSVAFSPDGSQLAAGCGDRTIRFYDPGTGKQTRLIRQHADWVQTVSFSRDGQELVSASRDRTARVLDAAKGELETTRSGSDVPLLAAYFSPYSSGNVWSLPARSREVDRWETKAPDKTDAIKFTTEVRAFGVGPAGLIVATAGNTALLLYPLYEKEPLFALYGHRDAVQSIAFHPRNTQQFASGSFDGEVLIWDLQCGTWVNRILASP